MVTRVSTVGDPHLGRTASSDASRLLVPAGRALFVLIFLISAPMHFTERAAQYAAQHGVPAPTLLVPLAGTLALVGGISVLIGYHARLGAALLALFLVPVTLLMHPFWGLADAAQAQLQQVMFLKNLAILGGTFLIIHYGAGPVSVDDASTRRHARGQTSSTVARDN